MNSNLVELTVENDKESQWIKFAFLKKRNT